MASKFIWFALANLIVSTLGSRIKAHVNSDTSVDAEVASAGGKVTWEKGDYFVCVKKEQKSGIVNKTGSFCLVSLEEALKAELRIQELNAKGRETRHLRVQLDFEGCRATHGYEFKMCPLKGKADLRVSYKTGKVHVPAVCLATTTCKFNAGSKEISMLKAGLRMDTCEYQKKLSHDKQKEFQGHEADTDCAEVPILQDGALMKGGVPVEIEAVQDEEVADDEEYDDIGRGGSGLA